MQEAIRKIVDRFGLLPHPEGGFYREVFRSAVSFDHPALDLQPRRSASTFIYFLLAERDFSAFHRVVASDEIWHLYAGGPLEIHAIDPSGRYEKHVLSIDLATGEPAFVVPAGWWQAARPAQGAAWAFSGCTVAPGFDFADFEMPPRDALTARFRAHENVIRELTRD